MRISSTQMVGGYLRQLNDAFESQTKLMEQSDGSSLHRPSDNAVNYSKYLRYEVSDTENNQYTSNVNTAVSWMTTSDNALVNVTSILKTVNEKTTAAANDTNNNKDWAAIGKEVMAELQEAVSDMNMQSGDRYVFSGQNDLVQPFVMSTDNVTRGLTKTLDSNQKEFFKSTVMFKEDGTVTTDKAEAKYTETCNPSQMMAMTGDDGKEYYLNTYTGKFYAKDFVDKGYKDCQVKGQSAVKDGDEAGTAEVAGTQQVPSCTGGKFSPAVKVSQYFDNQGVAKAASDIQFKGKVTVAKQDVVAGQLLDLDADQQTFFGTAGIAADYETDAGHTEYCTSTQMLAVKGNDDKDYYLNTYTGKVYTKDFVENGYKTCGHDTVADTDAVGKAADPTSRPSGKKNPAVDVYIDADHKVATASDVDFTKDIKPSFDTVSQKIVTYNGDDKYISMVKKNGPQDQTSDAVNLTGQDVFGSDIFDDGYSGNEQSGTAALNDLLTLQAKITAGDSKWLSSDGMTVANDAHSTVVNVETKVGARQRAYTDAKSMLESENTNITQDVTDVSGTDVAKLATQLMTAQMIYNMSLSVGAKILPGSLADYLS